MDELFEINIRLEEQKKKKIAHQLIAIFEIAV
jgi:hypothetical protein